MGRRGIFHTFFLLVEIEGHFTKEFVTYVYETLDWLVTHLVGGVEAIFELHLLPMLRKTLPK
jgi:hypothetical protein